MLTWEPVRNEYGLWEITTVTVIPPKILELVIRWILWLPLLFLIPTFRFRRTRSITR